MMAVHLLPGTAADGTVSWTDEIARGRSSAAFATLAGVAIAVAHGREPLRGKDFGGAAAGMLVRCALIGLLGMLVGQLDSGLAVILVYYALLFAIGVPLLAMSGPACAGAAVAVVIAVPALSFAVRPGLDPMRGTNPVLHDLLDPVRLLTELAVTGYYPVLGWVTYLAAGAAVGRLDLRSRRVAAWLLVGGITLALGANALSGWLLGTDAALAAMPLGAEEWVVHGTTPTSTDWWMAVDSPHSTTTLDLAHTTGTALALLGGCLLLARVASAALAPLAAAGACTLSLYCLHVTAVAAYPDPASPWTVYGLHVAVALLLGVAWRERVGRGPLESLVSVPARAVGRLVSPR